MCIESYYLFCVTAYPVILSEITDLSDESRNMVNFTCKAFGDPVPNISWSFNGVMINVSVDSSKYMIVSESINITTTKSTLTIYSATISDIGVYCCTASNIIGNDTSYGEKVICLKNYVMYILFQSAYQMWNMNFVVLKQAVTVMIMALLATIMIQNVQAAVFAMMGLNCRKGCAFILILVPVSNI